MRLLRRRKRAVEPVSLQERLRMIDRRLQSLRDGYRITDSERAAVRPALMATFGGDDPNSLIDGLKGHIQVVFRGLKFGVDMNDRPVTGAELAEGLRNHLSLARTEAVILEATRSAEGQRIFGECLDELERIAGELE